MFYTYAHTKSDGTIFYIGKGKKRRAWSKHSRNRHWNFVVAKHGFETVILGEFEDEQKALVEEIELIAHFCKFGCLVNMTPGGDNPPVLRGEDNPTKRPEVAAKISATKTGSHHTEETKKLISETRKASGIAKKENNPMWGKKRPEMTGLNHYMHNPEIAKKVSEKMKGGLNHAAKKVRFDGIIFGCIKDLAKHLGLNYSLVKDRVKNNPTKYKYEVLS